tara:strand:- start:139 stop:885 length:747 start_codon:yes stop_codon:yes gene_type:complete
MLLKKIYKKIIRKILFKIGVLKKPQIILDDFFYKKKNKFCIQIGANDGVMGDPIRIYLKDKSNLSAILIEPLDYYYKKLISLYKNRKEIKIMRNLVSNERVLKKIYYIDPKIVSLMNGDGPHNNWAHGQGSFSKSFIINEIQKNSFRGINYKKNINKFIQSIKYKKVKSIKISDIKISNNTQNLLVIDVQGFEYEVLKSINFKSQKFDLIYFEDEGTYQIKSKKIIKLLKENNYKLIGDDGINFVYAL